MKVDTIYYGANIFTMDDSFKNPEAVAVGDGKIKKVGNKVDIMTLRTAETEVIDLKEKCLMPGFIDTHGHLGMKTLFADWVTLLPKPVGNCRNFEDLISILKKDTIKKNLAPGDWKFETT